MKDSFQIISKPAALGLFLKVLCTFKTNPNTGLEILYYGNDREDSKYPPPAVIYNPNSDIIKQNLSAVQISYNTKNHDLILGNILGYLYSDSLVKIKQKKHCNLNIRIVNNNNEYYYLFNNLFPLDKYDDIHKKLIIFINKIENVFKADNLEYKVNYDIKKY